MQLCRRIDAVFGSRRSFQVSLLLIDDGSTASLAPESVPFHPQAIEKISILKLRRNLGHQRAIAVALAYIQEHCQADAVVVMDADGEDRPEDIPKLIDAMSATQLPTAVFAERGKRLENRVFRISYHVYRILHQFLAGRDIRFGNFSVLPWPHIQSLVVFPELWNHYAATFIKSRLPYLRVRSERAVRISGQSRMDFTALIVHGVSALFANQEVVGTRLLGANMAVTFALLLLMGVVVGVRLLTNLGIPGWATSTMGLLLILVSQALVASIMLVFSIMMNRNHLGFLPIRDYAYFVSRENTLFSR